MGMHMTNHNIKHPNNYMNKIFYYIWNTNNMSCLYFRNKNYKQFLFLAMSNYLLHILYKKFISSLHVNILLWLE